MLENNKISTRFAALFATAAMMFSAAAGATTLSGSPPTKATVGKLYSFTPTMSNPSSCSSCFRVRSLPRWAKFSASSGTLSGTPTAAGVFSNIRIYVRTRSGSASLPSFSITVSGATAVTPAPAVSISGTPATSATAGTFYSFKPTVTAASGATLTFTIANKPAWATFSSSTGTLSGTPGAANVATYSSIGVSVSDGTTRAALPAFAITVGAAPAATLGMVTLTWTVPTLNTDGSPLTDLSGYHIYYGTSASALSNQIVVGTPAATAASIENLTVGTWYFAISDYNSAGVESSKSSAVSMTVQ
jgi:hypothetical protein